MSDQSESKGVALRRVVQAVCEICGVTADQLMSPRRDAQMCLVRQMGVLVARRVTDASLREIGPPFGRDHATVAYAIAVGQQLAGEHVGVRETVARIAARAKELAGAEPAPTVTLPRPTLPRPRIVVALSPTPKVDPLALVPQQRTELARLKRKGWSWGGLARRYGISETQAEKEYQAETGAIAA